MSTFHKYGFHVNRTGDDVFDAIRRLKPQVIKTLEHDIGFWKRVRAIHPDAFLIGRLFAPTQEQERFVDDPTGKGRAFAERVLALECNNTEFNGRPLFDAWESYNEIMPGHASDDEKKKYNDFQVAFGERLRAGGFEPIGMNFATGNMRGEDFLTHFAGTLETYKYLGFHEYDWPDMWRLHKANIEEKGEEGMWLCLRYRRTMELEGVRAKYGDKHTVIITECGMTQGVSGGEDVGPWHESHPIEPERYWRSLLWYNNELLKDEYVMAACLFVVGAIHPWDSFEHLGPIMQRLAQLDRSGPDQPIPQPVPPEKEWKPEGRTGPEGTAGEEGADTTSDADSNAEETGQESGAAPAEQPALAQALLTTGQQHQVISFNPNAALQKRIFADGFVPNSTEFTLNRDGKQFVAQQAENLGNGEVRVYYVRAGQWDQVQFVVRAGSRGLPDQQFA